MNGRVNHMITDREKRQVLLIIVIAPILNFYWGVFCFIDQNWGKMSTNFLVAMILTSYFGAIIIDWDLATVTQRLKDFISNHLSTDYPAIKVDLSNRNKKVTIGYYLILLVFIPSFIFLGGIAGMKEKWLSMVIYFVSCVIVTEITIFLILRQRISVLSQYTEKIISEIPENKLPSNMEKKGNTNGPVTN